MDIRKIPVEQIIPADYNPRKDLKPGDPEYDKLKRSIEQFGYVEPLIWNKGHRTRRWRSPASEGAHRYGHYRSRLCGG